MDSDCLRGAQSRDELAVLSCSLYCAMKQASKRRSKFSATSIEKLKVQLAYLIISITRRSKFWKARPSSRAVHENITFVISN